MGPEINDIVDLLVGCKRKERSSPSPARVLRPRVNDLSTSESLLCRDDSGEEEGEEEVNAEEKEGKEDEDSEHLYTVVATPSSSSSQPWSLQSLPASGATAKLAFDIGASVGQCTERFLAAGYRVVAVEPHPGAAAELRRRLAPALAAGWLAVEERAIGPAAGVLGDAQVETEFFINEEDDEWSSLFPEIAGRFDCAYRPVRVRTTTLAALYAVHGVPDYVKVDTEGSDGICLEQLRGLPPPAVLSFECHSLAWLRLAAGAAPSGLGYTKFKLVRQSPFETSVCSAEGGECRHHCGPIGGDALCEVSGSLRWSSVDAVERRIRDLFLIYSEAGQEEFLKAPPRYIDHEWATLRACFPIESREAEEWYDVHCSCC
eukprot:gnl/TRDRNA2_/TRDRNA2_61316_c0_seq1.p1 gnl/TRDRNA2_/TRDRNA2_61316_c0~~gnl/TRDRNA2_/TRDRNA2_61316_c0_seq1.p1  ORF type:complete len:392 (-),score=73.60 gnl/TRDRNA2_/TRDRNA2_61316_c0_seq1:163-1284(-)